MRAIVWTTCFVAALAIVCSFATDAKSIVVIGNYTYICPNTCVVTNYSTGVEVHDSKDQPIYIVRTDGKPVPVEP